MVTAPGHTKGSAGMVEAAVVGSDVRATERVDGRRRPGSRDHERASRVPSDARTTISGLAVAAPVLGAIALGSAAIGLLSAGIALTASLLSPMTGLIALATVAPFPRPLIIPTPGLYVAMLGAILLGWFLRLPIERPRLGMPAAAVVLIGLFLIWVAAQFVTGVLDGPLTDRDSAIASSFAVFLTGAMSFVLAMLLLRGRSPYPVFIALLASAVVTSIIALAQSSGAEGLFLGLEGRSDLVNRTAVDRVTGPFLDPNYFGAYLSTAALLALGLVTVGKSRGFRLVLLAASAIIGLALMLTLSRGALVSLTAGLITMAFTRSIKTGILLSAAMVVAAVVAWPLFAEVRFAANPDVASGGLGSQLENSDRTFAWLAGLEAFVGSPVVGVGWDRLVELGSTGTVAHNWYVTLLAETGIVGFLLWAMFVAAIAVAVSRRPRPAQMVGYPILIAWMVSSLFIEVPKVYGATALALFALAAVLVADWGSDPASPSQAHSSKRDQTRIARSRPVRSGAIPSR